MDTFNEILLQCNLVKFSNGFDIKMTSVSGWLEKLSYKGSDVRVL